MANSRLQFKEDDKPTNSSKGKGLILETPYHPGFVDDKDLETIKMAVDKELSDISNAFYQTTERTADTIKRIDEIKIEGDGILAKIEEVDRVSKEGDEALSQRITTLSASVNDNASSIKTETEARANADSAMASQITSLKAESEAGDASLNQQMQVVSDKTGKLEAKWGVTVDVNGKVAGVELNNGTGGSAFSIRADKFSFSDTSGNQSYGFTSSGGVTTFTGSLAVADSSGAVGMKITNSQILVYDEHGRLRVKIGRLT